METNPAVAQAEAALVAAVAAFAAVLADSDGAPAGVTGGPGAGGARDAGLGFDDDPLQRVADGALDVLAAVARSEAKLAAAKVQAVAVFAEATKALNAPARSPYEAAAQERSLVAEVGCVLAIGDRAAGALLAESHALTTFLPGTLSALQAGTVSWAHARAMVDQTASLDAAGAAALEAHFLDPGTPRPAAAARVGEMPAYRFKAKARQWRERHHPESLEKRHAKSVADRRVEFWPDNDGMGWIAACLPADQASAIWDRLIAISREMQGPDEPRTLTQLRADNFASGLLNSGAGINAGNSPGGGEGTAPGPSSVRAQVLVTVPVFSLLGLTDEPAMLDGSGPIPASMARNLVANGAGSFYRALVDPRDGAPLEIGRTSYRLTKAMRNWLLLRDGKCPFPGCSNNSLDNEADHLLAWHQGGTTGISNLGQPCPKHHKLRHTGGWKPTPATKNEPPGWISPTGRHYKSEHQDWEPPEWPKWLEPEWMADGHHADGSVQGPRMSHLALPDLDQLDLELSNMCGKNPSLPEQGMPSSGTDYADPPLEDLPDFDIPEDPGVPEEELPEDPFAEWHLMLALAVHA
ncbi:HNH endonuclease signature motif containing protein [Arthrobacter sp. Alg241-R88]|uniref:HNH endonuclease signature motif containing protein n=1 Tax=Arthrobacter sp. Alg241-R88 TaxID=2305984 RepID=UPI0013D80B52|nr:HNH endonuclease signature motif containing protein [Arthrobacter sp. Alg241-R88]